ncbi:NAD synthetase [Marinobacter xestospongiae]|uniref:NAD synthetase n=1 Tax=Marinobacter xestospongiae TaxID=994319 RepID=UPI002004087B|nr:NAD synthetase [Marinobacter xestospongiae]MCK7569180.1 NAD synthetase [Marinobacter xestospongiae]
MQTQLLSVQFPFEQRQLKARLERMLDQRRLFAAIDEDPALIGAGVVFIDRNGTTVTLREFEPICFVKPVTIILREPPLSISSVEYVADVKTNPRENRLVLEGAGAVLACGSAVLGWVVLITAGVAIPFTGGGSVFLATLGGAAAVAGTAQCGNALYRAHNEIYSPEQNDQLDSEEWYQTATLALDAISLGGATAAGMVTFKGVKLLLSQGVKPRAALEGLNRVQRKRLTEEVARVRHPGISNKMLKFRQRTGEIPKRYSNEAIRATTIRQIKESVGVGLTVTGSATGGVIRQVAVAIVSEE